MYEPSPVQEVVYGPDSGTWYYYHWHIGINYDGSPITQWADAAHHDTTYSQKYPDIFIPGASYIWGNNFMPIALGSHYGTNYSKTDQQFRFELLDENEVVTNSARVTFSIISNSQSGYDPIVTHVKSYGGQTNKTPWEYDKNIANPITGIFEFNGVRVYWSPFLTIPDPWYPQYTLGLYLHPKVAWC